MNRFFHLLVPLAVIPALMLASCGNKPEKLVDGESAGENRREAEAPALEIAEELHDVRFSQSKGDKLQWMLKAKTVEQVAEGPISLEKVEITYYSDDGKVTVVTADTGLYDGARRDATLKGNVTVNTSDGGRVNTGEINWDQEGQVLTGEGEVTISRGDSTIKGKGFELFPNAETFRIFHVDGTVHKGDMEL